jgi:hypothetical protein
MYQVLPIDWTPPVEEAVDIERAPVLRVPLEEELGGVS